MQAIPARIIRQGKDEFTIDRGQESGVAVGQCVLSLTDTRLNDQCVVGIVSDVSRRWTQVKLITCPKCPLTVSLGKLSVPKTMEGRGGGTACISLVPTESAVKIKAGDIVYADRKPDFLDAPVIAGEVTQCQRNPDNPLVWDITVKPVCEVADLLDVVVLKAAAVR
jgi:cell shape-determining protein MreC